MPTWNATRNGTSRLHPTLCRRVWSRRLTFGALNSSSRSCLSTSATVVIDVHAAAKYGTKPLQYVLSHNTFEIVAAQLCAVTETAPKTQFLCVNRGPNPVWFSWRRKSFPEYCEYSLKVDTLGTRGFFSRARRSFRRMSAAGQHVFGRRPNTRAAKPRGDLAETGNRA